MGDPMPLASRNAQAAASLLRRPMPRVPLELGDGVLLSRASEGLPDLPVAIFGAVRDREYASI